MAILTVNTGSSSVRLALYDDQLNRLAREHRSTLDEEPDDLLREFLRRAGVTELRAVAHRVVHGGEHLTQPHTIDGDVEAEIERLAPLAPLHNPVALAWIRACRAQLGAALPQIAVFDTAFYADLPAVARTYALPHALCEQHGLRRYGFHGLAHEAMWRRWCALHPGDRRADRVISLQLGSGCSITAVAGGRAVDTSMGFSPLEGLVMGTRPGNVDPGLLLYLQRSAGYTPERLQQLLTQESGLLGVSGVSSSMKALLDSPDPRARLAVDLYCYRAHQYIGAYLATLGGADAILFAGGVGEHSPGIRTKILEHLGWAGIVIDQSRNAAATGETRIDHRCGETEIWVVPVDEGKLLAEAADRLLAKHTHAFKETTI